MDRPKGQKKLVSLAEVFALLKTPERISHFLLDVCTPAEIKAMSERWTVCQLLAEGGASYRQISERTGTSLTTIVRVARFLNEEPYGGYRDALQEIASLSADNEDAYYLAGTAIEQIFVQVDWMTNWAIHNNYIILDDDY